MSLLSPYPRQFDLIRCIKCTLAYQETDHLGIGIQLIMAVGQQELTNCLHFFLEDEDALISCS